MNKTSILNIDYRKPIPNNLSVIYLGMGCFWGAERKFWDVDGVFSQQPLAMLEVIQKTQTMKRFALEIQVTLRL